MTLTDCMNVSSDGHGYDCRHCGLHVDQCVQEDDLYLQDERYKLEAELTKSKYGRALSTVAHRTLHFSDTAYRLNSMEAGSHPTTAGRRCRREINLFTDAPLSNARQPELKTFTFREESVDSPVPVVAYHSLPSPRYTIRTIARPLVASSTASEESDETASEQSVDWPDAPGLEELGGGEVSVDGPPLLKRRPEQAERFSGETIPVIYAAPLARRAVLSTSDGFESSTSVDTLSSESGEYSVVGQKRMADFSGQRQPPGGKPGPAEVVLEGKSVADVNLYRLFYPNRVPPIQTRVQPVDQQHRLPVIIDSPVVLSPIDQNTTKSTGSTPDVKSDRSTHFPPTADSAAEETVDTTTCTRTVITTTETTTEETIRIERSSRDASADSSVRPPTGQPEDQLPRPASTTIRQPKQQHLLTPLSQRLQEVRAVRQAQQPASVVTATTTARPDQKVGAADATVLSGAGGVNERQWNSIQNKNSFLGVPKQRGKSGKDLSQSSPELSARNRAGSLRKQDAASGQTDNDPPGSTQSEPSTGQPMTSTLRYSLPPAPATQIPITGSSFKSDYPSTAQLLAQQREQRYDYLYDGAGSPISTGTLPYTVDGTKVIYPVVGAKKPAQAHSYASSRVSTTSELDGCYAPSPSPSIPDSTFSVASRGSNGRLSRRSHATIYLKGTEANPRSSNSQSKVDLTVESEDGVPADQLHRVPAEAQQRVIGRRSSTSSSSSGRGIQKLTIKMILKEKKSNSGDASRSIQPAQVRRSPPLTAVAPSPQPVQQQPHSTRQDDLPNGATAASTSYRKPLYEPSEQPIRRAVSSHTSRYYSSTGSSGKPRLSSSEVELSQPEILTTTSAMQDQHVPIYERRPPNGTRDSTMSRGAYSQASNSSLGGRDPSKPIPYRSYERLDVINDDGGRVMREVVEELRGDHISIQVHEKGDGLSEARVAQIKNDERNDLERLEQTRPNLEIAMTSDRDGLLLPEKPVSPGRSRREKYELYQAMAWQRDITEEDPNGQRSRTPVSFHEIEYETRPGRRNDAVVHEETRVAESRSVSAPAPVPKLPVTLPPPIPLDTRVRYPDRQQPIPPPIHTSMQSSSMYSTTEHKSNVSYRSIFDKRYTDERINELRKSANDLRTLTGQIEPWSTRRGEQPLSTLTNTSQTGAPTNFKCDYPPAVPPPPERGLPPYREPFTSRPSNGDPRPSTYAPPAPPRASSTRSSAYDPPADRQYSHMESYTHESLSKTTTSSATSYRPSHVEKDPEYKYITQYKSSPTLNPKSSADPGVSGYRDSYLSRKPDAYNATKPAEPSPYRYEPSRTGYVPYVSSTVGITSLPRSTNSYGQPITGKPSDTYAGGRPVDPVARRSETGQPPLPRDFISAIPKKEPVRESFAYKPYESGTTSTSSTFEKPKPAPAAAEKPKYNGQRKDEPRSTGSSWAYGHKLPDEQFRSFSADRPDSRQSDRPLKTVEPAVIEALKPKRPEPPSSPYVPPKDYVPPCKAKILKRKFMNQPIPTPVVTVHDDWDRYKSGSRERVQLRISRESLDAINKEATRGQRTRMSAPDLNGSMRNLVNPGVYRSKIQWPEREIQAKLSASQEYLARRYQAEYGDDPTTSSFANRWDARSRSLPPMSRYSKSAATTPSETPYPEYMDSNKAKSMEFLADVKKFDYQIVPENQLQRENISGYARPPRPSESEYGDQIRKSLQKLDLPDWYVNSPYSQPGIMEGTVLRNRTPSTTHSDYSTYATMDRSELVSPTGTMQSSDAQVLSRRTVHRDPERNSKPNLSTSRDEKTWEGYTAPFYNKKTPRPAAIYSPASETHQRQHDSGYWNNHHESSQDSDESTNGRDSRRSPRAWTSNAPKRAPATTPLSTSSSSAWYVPPLQRRDHSAPERVSRSYSDHRVPEDHQYRREAPPYVPPAGESRPSTMFEPSTQRRIIQSTPWEVTSIKTETVKTEKLAKKNFVTETNDPVKINQFSHSNAQWGSYV